MASPVYCPRCGTQMQRRFTEGRDRDVCPSCGYVFYRNPVPAVGVVVALDERVVLIKRKYEPRANCWGLPAGYMELGESAEEAAIRECHEETGLLVQVDHILGVYSFGNNNQSGLIIIYAATAVGGELVAGDDAIEAGAFALDALPLPIAFHTHLQAIERWRRHGHLNPTMLNLTPDQDQEIIIRYPALADIPAALALLTNELTPGVEDLLVADTLIHDWLRDPDRPVLIAELEGVVAGVAALSFHQTLRGWYASLDDLVVAPVYRRRGIGVSLIETTCRLARARGCTAIHFSIRSPEHAEEPFLTEHGFMAGNVLTRDLRL